MRRAEGDESCTVIFLFQSTHPRGMRRETGPHPALKFIVSIHASARDATHIMGLVTGTHHRFNPRIREGCDVMHRELDRAFGVSIHASARDATSLTSSSHSPSSLFQSTHPRGMRLKRVGVGGRGLIGFNPRIREGCDRSGSYLTVTELRFQSTHPRGMRRRQCRRLSAPRQGFNPRIREGCDGVSREETVVVNVVSIHASARDATTPRALRR